MISVVKRCFKLLAKMNPFGAALRTRLVAGCFPQRVSFEHRKIPLNTGSVVFRLTVLIAGGLVFSEPACTNHDISGTKIL